ncbi:MAG: DUF4489 domain-containing protein [Syntrophomonadaceae bacterium]|nr:DUF4489 domain-containing protein [Syntrophomonadaceae bacterium]
MKCNMNYREAYKYDPVPGKEERKPFPPPHPHYKYQTETILRCGTSVGSIPLSCGHGFDGAGVNGAVIEYRPTILASVTLDTSKLIDSTVKIDFSSLISFKTISDYNYFLRLVFRLSKICDGCPIPLGNWAFEAIQRPGVVDGQIDSAYIQETESFSFSWCGCEECPGCCRYILELVDQQSYGIDFVAVSNISISALAVGLKKVK